MNKFNEKSYWIQTTIWFDTNITYFVSFETKIIYQNNYCTSKSAKYKNKIYISKIKYTFLKKLFKILMSKNYQNRWKSSFFK